MYILLLLCYYFVECITVYLSSNIACFTCPIKPHFCHFKVIILPGQAGIAIPVTASQEYGVDVGAIEMRAALVGGGSESHSTSAPGRG